MSEQNAQVLDPDTAYAHVHQQVYSPVFFEKLSSDYGIAPESEQEAMEMLTMASQLREGYEQTEKSGADQGSMLTAARSHLTKAATETGLSDGAADSAIQEVAARVAQDPAIAHAVLSLQAGAASNG